MAGAVSTKGRKWELLHSLWIGWTFALGFFSWLAFIYIGLRTRHTRWMLWALFYTTPLILLLVFRPEPGSGLANLMLSATVALGMVSTIHAFLIRKEYLLRLELLQRETSNVSVTSRGKRWEWLHSLWIGWTFVLGLFSWVAFIYIGLRVRRIRWVVWGLLYSMVFIAFAITSRTAGPGSDAANAMVTLMIVVGIVSVVHAFLVRNDYLILLENQLHKAAETDALQRRRLEAQYGLRTKELPISDSPGKLEPGESSDVDTDARVLVTPETTDDSSSIDVAPLTHVEWLTVKGFNPSAAARLQNGSQ